MIVNYSCSLKTKLSKSIISQRVYSRTRFYCSPMLWQNFQNFSTLNSVTIFHERKHDNYTHSAKIFVRTSLFYFCQSGITVLKLNPVTRTIRGVMSLNENNHQKPIRDSHFSGDMLQNAGITYNISPYYPPTFGIQNSITFLKITIISSLFDLSVDSIFFFRFCAVIR